MRLPIILAIAVGLSLSLPAVIAAQPTNYTAHLTGDQEVPPRDTDATGQATFQANDGSLRFRLIVANIENVTAAHIHCGAKGVNGPVGVTLFSGGAPGSGPVNGVLAQGTITAPDPNNNGCGWTTMAQVIAAMDAGVTYVNVHTNDGVAPTNTGPGDFPGGEIRGQIQ